MGFHAYTPPADMIYFTSPVRRMMYDDASIVGGKVQLWLSYDGGAFREMCSRDDGVWLPTSVNVSYDQGAVSSGVINGNFAPQSAWVISSKRLQCTTSFNKIAIPFGSATQDFTWTVIAPTTNKIGVATRSNNSITSADVWLLNAATGKLTLQVGNDASAVVWTSTTTFTAGTTYTLRMVASSNTYTVYVNGTLEATINLTAGAQQANNANTYLGLYAVGVTDTSGGITSLYCKPWQDPAATTVTVKNMDGTTVYTTSLPTSSDHSMIEIPDSSLTQRGSYGPYGWYRVTLTGSDHLDGQWGTAYGDTAFCRIPNSPLPMPSSVPIHSNDITSANDKTARSHTGKAILGLAANRIATQFEYVSANDAVTNGTATVTSASSSFNTRAILGQVVIGTNIPRGTVAADGTMTGFAYVGAVNSATSISLSSSPTSNVPLNATGSGTGGYIQVMCDPNGSGEWPKVNNIPDAQDIAAANARPVIFTIVPYTGGIEPWVKTMASVIAPYFDAIECTNEPDGYATAATFASDFAAFYRACKAGAPNLPVLGPSATGINAGGTWFQDFVAATTQNPDGWSFHAYNSYGGEIAMMRRNLSKVVTAINNR